MKNKRTYEIYKLENLTVNYSRMCFGVREYVGGIFNREICSNFETQKEAKEYIKKYFSDYRITDYSKDEIVEFYESIDFEPLKKKVCEIVGMPIHLNIDLIFKSGNYRITFKSEENLVDYFQMLRAAWKEMKVSEFNSCITCDKETGELYYWGNLDYSYEHKDGGTNGATILNMCYKNNEWSFK